MRSRLTKASRLSGQSWCGDCGEIDFSERPGLLAPFHGCMKNHRFITLCTTLLALGAAAVVFVPVTRAADDEVKETAAAARKAKREKELEKYDTNHDGKLEAD